MTEQTNETSIPRSDEHGKAQLTGFFTHDVCLLGDCEDHELIFVCTTAGEACAIATALNDNIVSDSVIQSQFIQFRSVLDTCESGWVQLDAVVVRRKPVTDAPIH